MPPYSAMQCRDIWYSHQRAPSERRDVLKGVEAEFPPAEAAIIRGPIGVGKTTLLKIMAGLQRPTRGEVVIGEQAISRWRGPFRDKFRQQVGFVFQNLGLFDHRTVQDNLMVPLIPLGLSRYVIQSWVDGRLDELGIRHLRDVTTGSLSGGERQLTAIARALIVRPRYLFMDEPSAFQDPAGVERIKSVIRSNVTAKAIVIVATQDPRLDDQRLFGRCYQMSSGRLEALEC